MLRYSAATRSLGAALTLAGLVSCTSSQPSPVPSPAPTPTPGPAGTMTVTGNVLEYMANGSSRPVPGLRLKVWRSTGSGGVLDASPLPDVVSAADGTITIPDVMPGTLFFQTMPEAEYRFLCDAYPFWAHPDLLRPPTNQLPVVHRSWTGTRPPNGWLIGTTFYGVVTERDSAGNPQPVEGATVDVGMPDPPARTNADGFYMICSTVGSDQFRTIAAAKAGYDTQTREVFFGIGNTVFNFELTRRLP